MKILILIVLMVGCGQIDHVYNTKFVDSHVETEYNNFLAAAQQYGKHPNINQLATIEYTDAIDVEDLGQCDRMNDGTNKILLSNDLKTAGEPEFRLIMFHELGHCLLGLDHNTEDTSAIMYPIVNQAMLFGNWDNQVAQLMESAK